MTEQRPSSPIGGNAIPTQPYGSVNSPHGNINSPQIPVQQQTVNSPRNRHHVANTFTFDMKPNWVPGDSPSHTSLHSHSPTGYTSGHVQGHAQRHHSAGDASSVSGGSLSPMYGSPQHSPLHAGTGTAPGYTRKRAHLNSVTEESEDEGFEKVPRPENALEAHRLANNYMVRIYEV